MFRKILLIICLLAVTGYATVDTTEITFDVVTSGTFDQRLRTWIGTLNTDIAAAAIENVGTGSIFYVDSGAAADGAGTSWSTAHDTLQEGVDACTEHNGDIIYVAQGHAEEIGSAAALTLDCNGITIIGMGHGDDIPELSLTALASTVSVTVSDILIYNIRFLGDWANGSTLGLDIQTGGDGTKIINCQFRENSNDEELLIPLNVSTTADDLVIMYNSFITASGGDGSSAIKFEGSSARTIVAYNRFDGDWSDYVILGTAGASTQMLIQGNVIHNLDGDEGKLISFNGSTTGDIIGNIGYGVGAAQAIVANAMFVSPDNVTMTTENVETRTYEAMIGAYTGAGSAAASDNILQDFVLIDALLDLIIADFTDYQLDHLAGVDTTVAADANLATYVVDGSVLSHLMTTGANGSDYAASTMSLQALGADVDAIIVDTGTDLVAQIAGIATSIAAMHERYGYAGTCEINAGGTTFATCASLGGFGDDYFNTGWSLMVVKDAGGSAAAPEGDIIDIIDYTSDTGLFELNVAAGAAITTNDGIMIVRREELNLDDNAMLGSSGDVLYVDNGTSGDGSGLTMENAYASITLALDGATESTDIIIVASGHVETIGAAYAIDDAGLIIRGLGEGMLRPTLTLGTETDDVNFDVSAANVTFDNLIFSSDLANLVSCFDVAGGGDGLTIKNCLFTSTGTGTEFLTAIDLTTGADDVRVENCIFLAVGTDADAGIGMIAGAVDNLQVIDCIFIGAYDDSCVYSDQTITNALIKNNVFRQDEAGKEAFGVGDSATGLFIGNHVYANDYGTMYDSGAMFCIDNWGTDAVDQHEIQIPISAETTDITPVADGSELERLELLQEMTDDALAALGLDQAVENTYYVDSVAAIGGTGKTWETADVNLVLALAEATTATAPTIFFAANHTENIGNIEAINKAGVSFIGLGVGEARPKLTFNSLADVLAHTVPNVKYKNIIFIAGTQDTTAAVTLNADSDGAVFEDCEFRGDHADIEFLSCVTLASGCDDVRFTRCKFDNVGGADGTAAITMIAGVCDNVIIEDCEFRGGWSTGAVYSDNDAHTGLIIRNNSVQNTDTGIGGIVFAGAATGELSGNKCYGDTLGVIIDPGSLKCFNNYVSHEINETGYLFPAQRQKIDSVHGTGRIIYVDSGASAGGGGTWETAFNTIDAAMDDTSADRGDIIYVAQGHVEDEGAAASIFTCDVNGVSIIGIGDSEGGVTASGACTTNQIPIFILHTNTAATATVSADNVTLKNLKFEADDDNIAVGLTVAVDSNGLVVDGCYFRDGAADEELVIGISVAADVDNVQIKDCVFSTYPGGACANAIKLAGGSDDSIISGNTCYGTWSTGVLLASGAASRNLTVKDNIFVTTSANVGVAFNAAGTGVLARNFIGTTESIGNSLTGTNAMFCFENYITGAVDASGLLDPGADGD